MNLVCIDCGKILTDEERHYYGVHCNDCEIANFNRVEAWRKGEAEDAELDAMYSAPPPLKH